jgi:hypothetical protein
LIDGHQIPSVAESCAAANLQKLSRHKKGEQFIYAWSTKGDFAHKPIEFEFAATSVEQRSSAIKCSDELVCSDLVLSDSF